MDGRGWLDEATRARELWPTEGASLIKSADGARMPLIPCFRLLTKPLGRPNTVLIGLTYNAAGQLRVPCAIYEAL